MSPEVREVFRKQAEKDLQHANLKAPPPTDFVREHGIDSNYRRQMRDTLDELLIAESRDKVDLFGLFSLIESHASSEVDGRYTVIVHDRKGKVRNSFNNDRDDLKNALLQALEWYVGTGGDKFTDDELNRVRAGK